MTQKGLTLGRGGDWEGGWGALRRCGEPGMLNPAPGVQPGKIHQTGHHDLSAFLIDMPFLYMYILIYYLYVKLYIKIFL